MKPSLLIASPQLRDDPFERTLVLLWHHDASGAIGVVVNRPREHFLPDVLELPDDVDASPYAETTVVWGGPVEPGSGTVVTRGEVSEEDGWNLDGLGVSRSMTVLVDLIRAREPVLLCLGYAGWGPGQLDEEIKRGGWLWTEVDAALVFDVPADDRYDRALATLGLTQHTVWMQPIDE